MNKKAKITLKVYESFLETRAFVDKSFNKACRKENISVDYAFFYR